MYERFTDRVRKVMQLANQEAQRQNVEYIGTEHILLGIAREGSGVAVYILNNLGVQPEKIITEVEKLASSTDFAYPITKLPSTPRAKMVIEYAMLESRNLKHGCVGTEHILLGLLREDEGVASQVLMNLGLSLERVRDELVALLGSRQDASKPSFSRASAGWKTDSPANLAELDEETRRRVRELAEKIAPLQSEKEDAIARRKFLQAVKLRNRQKRYWTELDSLNLPEYVLENVKRFVNARNGMSSKLPLLDMFDDESGEADATLLSVLPIPLVPPVKIVFATVPRFPVGTLRAVLTPDDICSPWFRAVVPLFSTESISERKGNHEEMLRCAFHEIARAQNPTWGRPVLLCVVRPTRLPENLRREVFAGIQQTNCDFVIFETGDEVHKLLGQLAGIKLWER